MPSDGTTRSGTSCSERSTNQSQPKTIGGAGADSSCTSHQAPPALTIVSVVKPSAMPSHKSWKPHLAHTPDSVPHTHSVSSLPSILLMAAPSTSVAPAGRIVPSLSPAPAQRTKRQHAATLMVLSCISAPGTPARRRLSSGPLTGSDGSDGMSGNEVPSGVSSARYNASCITPTDVAAQGVLETPAPRRRVRAVPFRIAVGTAIRPAALRRDEVQRFFDAQFSQLLLLPPPSASRCDDAGRAWLAPSPPVPSPTEQKWTSMSPASPSDCNAEGSWQLTTGGVDPSVRRASMLQMLQFTALNGVLSTAQHVWDEGFRASSTKRSQ